MDDSKIAALESGVSELLELALAEKNPKLRTIYNDVASIFAGAASELRSAREEIRRLTQDADSWSHDAKTPKAECEHLRAQLSAPEASAVTVDGCDALLQDALLAIKRREAYPGELSYLERQLNEILIRTPVPARSLGT